MIDSGAHPNEQAIFSTLRTRDVKTDVAIEMHFLSANRSQIAASLKTTALCGWVALEAFGNIWGTRFALIGLQDAIRKIRHGL